MQPEGPYHLIGWSLGGTLAAMIAARLEADAQTVAFLGLIDPFIPNIDEPDVDDWLRDFSDFVSVLFPNAATGIDGIGRRARNHLTETACIRSPNRCR